MKQYPATDKLHGQLGDKHHQLRHQDQCDEMQVTVTYSRTHQRLGEERKDKLQQADSKHSQQQLHNLVPVKCQVTGDEAYNLQAEAMLDKLIENCNDNTPLTYSNGLCGIGVE